MPNNNFLKNKNKNKKGQMSDTIVWVVATVIIFFILVIFFFASSFLAGVKELGVKSTVFFLDDSDLDKNNLFELKTALAYQKNSNNKIVIDNWINFPNREGTNNG